MDPAPMDMLASAGAGVDGYNNTTISIGAGIGAPIPGCISVFNGSRAISLGKRMQRE
jgi:hypothetical protein